MGDESDSALATVITGAFILEVVQAMTARMSEKNILKQGFASPEYTETLKEICEKSREKIIASVAIVNGEKRFPEQWDLVNELVKLGFSRIASVIGNPQSEVRRKKKNDQQSDVAALRESEGFFKHL